MPLILLDVFYNGLFLRRKPGIVFHRIIQLIALHGVSHGLQAFKGDEGGMIGEGINAWGCRCFGKGLWGSVLRRRCRICGI